MKSILITTLGLLLPRIFSLSAPDGERARARFFPGISPIFSFAFCLLLVLLARAWNDCGHMTVAELAEEQLKQ